MPKTQLPPEGAAEYLAFQKGQLAKCSRPEVDAIQGFTYGYDWTIREIDKGRPAAEILAAINAHRAASPAKVFRETPEEHLATAQQYHRDIYAALHRMSPVSERFVYRGLSNLTTDVFNAILASEHVEIGALSSSSWNVGVADEFAGTEIATPNAHSVIFKLKAKSARAIESISAFQAERELLLLKGSRFRVTRVYRPEGSGADAAAVIEAEEL